MKRTITNAAILSIVALSSLSFSLLQEKGEIHLKVSKEENGETSTFEKSYSSITDLKSDEELKKFDLLVDEWAHEKNFESSNKIYGKKNKNETPKAQKSIEAQNIIHDDLKRFGEYNIVVRYNTDEDGISKNDEMTIKIRTDKRRNEYTLKIDDESKHNIAWTDAEGNKSNLTSEDIEEIIEMQREGKEGDFHKIEVTSSGDRNVDQKVVVVSGRDDTDFRNKMEENEYINQYMDINIEEDNGDKFIDIEITRSKSIKVKISEFETEDRSVDQIDYSLKNNLSASQLSYFPNPSNGKFHLKFTVSANEDVMVKVMDILGNEVYKEKIMDFNGVYDNQIDLTGKEKGIYVLQILQKKKVLSRKILIE